MESRAVVCLVGAYIALMSSEDIFGYRVRLDLYDLLIAGSMVYPRVCGYTNKPSSNRQRLMDRSPRLRGDQVALGSLG